MKRISRITFPLLQTSSSRIHLFRPLQPPSLRQHVLPILSPSFRRYSSAQQTFVAKACSECDSPLNIREISCKNCRSLTPLPENVHYLSLFGFSSLPPFEFDIDLRKLKSEYLKMMSKVHPDSVIDKSDVPLTTLLSLSLLALIYIGRNKNVLQITFLQRLLTRIQHFKTPFQEQNIYYII